MIAIGWVMTTGLNVTFLYPAFWMKDCGEDIAECSPSARCFNRMQIWSLLDMYIYMFALFD